MRIAIVGRAGVGKTTAGLVAAEVLGAPLIDLGDGLREVAAGVSTALGLSGRGDRAALAAVAGAVEGVAPGFLARWATMRAGRGSAVCCGVRRPSEADVLRAAGWWLVRVECDEEVRRRQLLARGDTGPVACESERETESIAVDATWRNDAPSADAWRAAVRALVEALPCC